MNKFTTAFFDWGGVIASNPGDTFLRDLLLDVGAHEDQLSEIFSTYMKQLMKGEITSADFWHELRTKYALDIPDDISQRFREWSGLVANEDVMQLVEDLRGQGIKVYVLSNIIESSYIVIDEAGYYDRFDGVIASCRVGSVKPEIAIYEIALERAGVTAGESVFIDDQQRCLDPAQKMGMATVLATSPRQVIQDVRALFDT